MPPCPQPPARAGLPAVSAAAPRQRRALRGLVVSASCAGLMRSACIVVDMFRTCMKVAVPLPAILLTCRTMNSYSVIEISLKPPPPSLRAGDLFFMLMNSDGYGGRSRRTYTVPCKGIFENAFRLSLDQVPGFMGTVCTDMFALLPPASPPSQRLWAWVFRVENLVPVLTLPRRRLRGSRQATMTSVWIDVLIHLHATYTQQLP